jgi:hypothetical protein
MARSSVTLHEVQVEIDVSVVPDNVREFLADADARIEAWMADQARKKPLGFVPSDFEAVYATLHDLTERGLATGRSLLEWGSGFGTVASMSTWLDFDPHGIEIHRDLVEQAEQLAADHELPVQFHYGSFVPRDGEPLTDAVPDSHWLESGRPVYEDIGLTIDDFDVVFAYPWPGEEEVTADIFDHYAQTGALLVTYHGYEGVLVRRKG